MCPSRSNFSECFQTEPKTQKIFTIKSTNYKFTTYWFYYIRLSKSIALSTELSGQKLYARNTPFPTSKQVILLRAIAQLYSKTVKQLSTIPILLLSQKRIQCFNDYAGNCCVVFWSIGFNSFRKHTGDLNVELFGYIITLIFEIFAVHWLSFIVPRKTN